MCCGQCEAAKKVIGLCPCRSNGFDGFMRSVPTQKKDKSKSRRSMSVPLGASSGGGMPQHIKKLLKEETPKWKSSTANECGRTFGERNSAVLGANLYRHEREAQLMRKIQTVDSILRSFEHGNSVLSNPMYEASQSMLPLLNPRSSNLKLGAGYIKVELATEAAGISVFNGVHKPWRGRDSGGMSPPIKMKARLRQDASNQQEFNQLKTL